MAKMAEAIKKEKELAPEDDIFSRLLQGANSILKVAQLSGNLKEQFQGLLKRTAAEVRAASCALNERLARERESSEDELRRKLVSLKKELGEQKRELEALRAGRTTAAAVAAERSPPRRVVMVEEVQVDLDSLRSGARGVRRTEPTPTPRRGVLFPTGRDGLGGGITHPSHLTPSGSARWRALGHAPPQSGGRVGSLPDQRAQEGCGGDQDPTRGIDLFQEDGERAPTEGGPRWEHPGKEEGLEGPKGEAGGSTTSSPPG